MSVLCINRKYWLVFVVLSILPVIARVSVAQPLPDLPIIYEFGIGARAMGMGQAHVAACEDVTATFYNPAALAQIRRIEVSTGFSHLNENLETFLFDQKSTTTLGSTKLSSVGLAYPFPTYRGSLVLAVAYNRTRNTDSDYFRFGEVPDYYLAGLDNDYNTFVSGQEQFARSERGGISNWTAGLGTEVSQNVSVGAGVSFLNGKSEVNYAWTSLWDLPELAPNEVYQQFVETDDANITGWTASIGTLVKLGEVGRIGLTIRLPEYLNLSIETSSDSVEFGPAANIEFSEDAAYEDKITLPMSFVAGASAAPIPGLILALDVKYTDWKQIDYAGPIKILVRRDNFYSEEYAYRATISLRLGAEYMLPFVPFRIRGGFFTEPIAFRLLPDVTNIGGPMIASIDSDGKFYTVGAGYLFEEAFALDAAWVHGGFERSVPDYSEKKTTDKIFVTASYRF